MERQIGDRCFEVEFSADEDWPKGDRRGQSRAIVLGPALACLRLDDRSTDLERPVDPPVAHSRKLTLTPLGL